MSNSDGFPTSQNRRVRKGRGRVRAAPAPGTLKFTHITRGSQPSAHSADRRAGPHRPKRAHLTARKTRKPSRVCVRQATNTSPRHSLPQERARAARSLQNRRLKSPQCPGPGARSGPSRPHPPPAPAAAGAPWCPQRQPGAVRASRVPSKPAGSRPFPSLWRGSSGRRSSPEQPEEPPHSRPRPRGSGRAAQARPPARPAPAPLRDPGPGHGPEEGPAPPGWA